MKFLGELWCDAVMGSVEREFWMEIGANLLALVLLLIVLVALWPFAIMNWMRRRRSAEGTGR